MKGLASWWQSIAVVALFPLLLVGGLFAALLIAGIAMALIAHDHGGVAPSLVGEAVLRGGGWLTPRYYRSRARTICASPARRASPRGPMVCAPSPAA